MILGILIFVDDYFNCLTVGSVMRPVTDRHKVSTKRQKLLSKMNAQQELEYWQGILKQVKKGSDAWYTAYETIKNLKKEIKNDTKEAADDAKGKGGKGIEHTGICPE